MIIEPTYLTALIAGVVPALLWLSFWLYQDRARPEPRYLIALGFLCGMASVLIIVPFQKVVSVDSVNLKIIIWAAMEEIIKTIIIVFIILRNKSTSDERIDYIVYAIVPALGFASLENALFLIEPLSSGDLSAIAFAGNARFLGTTLLHALCSGIVGLSMAIICRCHPFWRGAMVAIGVSVATMLHAFFNISIMSENNLFTFLSFVIVWVGLAILLAFCGKLRNMSDCDPINDKNI